MKLSGVWRVVLDCSTFLSGVFYPLGKPNQVLRVWVDKKFDLYLSEEIYKEYELKIEEIAKRLKKEPTKGKLWFKLIDRRAIFIKPRPLPKDYCRDPNDLKYLEAAADSGADFLISSDKDLLVLKKFEKTKIVSPDQFLKINPKNHITFNTLNIKKLRK